VPLLSPPLRIAPLGFDGYDRNATTVRVRFLTDEQAAALSANGTSSSNASANNDTSAVIEVPCWGMPDPPHTVLFTPASYTRTFTP
jgi:hypothetical protein